MSDLADKIIAAIGQLEALALSASPGPWKPNAEHDEVLAEDDIRVAEGFALSNRQLRATVDHMVANDPIAVLRRCAADREIVEQHRHIWITPGAPEFNDAHLTSEPMPVCASCRPETMFRRADSWPCRTLLAVARDYRVTP